MRTQIPETLHRTELDLEHEPVTRSPQPVPVLAWIRYGHSAVRVNGEAVAWTQHAVEVRWTTPEGAQHEAWLWASAVRRRSS